jgi:hypothetical protein
MISREDGSLLRWSRLLSTASAAPLFQGRRLRESRVPRTIARALPIIFIPNTLSPTDDARRPIIDAIVRWQQSPRVTLKAHEARRLLSEHAQTPGSDSGPAAAVPRLRQSHSRRRSRLQTARDFVDVRPTGDSGGGLARDSQRLRIRQGASRTSNGARQAAKRGLLRGEYRRRHLPCSISISSRRCPPASGLMAPGEPDILSEPSRGPSPKPKNPNP